MPYSSPSAHWNSFLCYWHPLRSPSWNTPCFWRECSPSQSAVKDEVLWAPVPHHQASIHMRVLSGYYMSELHDTAISDKWKDFLGKRLINMYYLSFLVFQVYEFLLLPLFSDKLKWPCKVIVLPYIFLSASKKWQYVPLPVNFKLYEETSTSGWSALSSADQVTFSAASRRCNKKMQPYECYNISQKGLEWISRIIQFQPTPPAMTG